MDHASAPRVYPWVALGFAVGLAAAAIIALAAWGRSGDDDQVTLAAVVAVSGTTALFGVIVGLAVGQFIRIAGIVRAWRPTFPTVLGAPVPSPNGHGSTEGIAPEPFTNGTLFGVLSAISAIVAAAGALPLSSAPIVLGIGALALDERAWVRIAASGGVFVAAFALAGFLVSNVVEGRSGGPVFLALIVLIGVVEFVTVRRVRPRR